jgi:simple sugar transport system permease protein
MMPGAQNGLSLSVRRYISGFTVYAAALAIAFGVFALLVSIMGYRVPPALFTLVSTSFRSGFGFEETVKKTIPLIFTTYAFTIPFTIRFFNIGAWGQMLFGGTVTAVVALSLRNIALPGLVMLPLLLLVGIGAGGAFGLVAGYLKAKHDINPIISTIMLNFIAAHFVNFVATAPPFKDPAEGHPITISFPAAARMGFFGGVPHSVILALAAIVFVAVLLKWTRLGYEIIAVGHNLRAARTYGIDFSKTILLTFLMGGALAGLGGCLEVVNIHGRLIEGFAQTSGAQYGIFGILTSLVVAGNPIGVPVAAFLMSVLLVGADSLQRTMQIPVELVFLSQALIVLSIVSIRERFGGKG